MTTTERSMERPLTTPEQEQWARAIDDARALQAELLAQRGGRLFRPAEDDIAEAREQRSATRQ